MKSSREVRKTENEARNIVCSLDKRHHIERENDGNRLKTTYRMNVLLLRAFMSQTILLLSFLVVWKVRATGLETHL